MIKENNLGLFCLNIQETGLAVYVQSIERYTNRL